MLRIWASSLTKLLLDTENELNTQTAIYFKQMPHLHIPIFDFLPAFA